jgi:hypothetical protein
MLRRSSTSHEDPTNCERWIEAERRQQKPLAAFAAPTIRCWPLIAMALAPRFVGGDGRY